MTNSRIKLSLLRSRFSITLTTTKSTKASAALILATLVLITAASTTAATAQTFTTLYTFEGPDGANPTGAMVQATDGNLYGTTPNGGYKIGVGTVFKITPSGTLTTLYTFCPLGGNCLHGYNPFAGLIQATDGNFYGTTYAGGANAAGTVFKITPTGTLTTLHIFASTDGDGPYASLIQATDGNFYSTTYAGGTNGYGTIFKMTPGGTLTTLHSFDSTDGANPAAALIQATDGNFYGTTNNGGANAAGTVFKITQGGTFSTLYSFCSQSGCSDGGNPFAALVQAADGNLYGTTCGAACSGANGYGTVFRITRSGALTTLHSFEWTDGAYPQGALVQATDGSFYGTTADGGAIGPFGSLFRITRGGVFTLLYSFCPQGNACSDGAVPVAALLQDTNGTFYGTAEYGGSEFDIGTIISLSVGLKPFVKPQTTSGKPGNSVNILGTNLTGATSVAFNSVAASFTVISNSLMKATVPTGATTGLITVTTPRGTLSSNIKFRVLP